MLTLGGKMQSQTPTFRTKQDLHLARKLFHFIGVIFMVGCLIILPKEICGLALIVVGGSFVTFDLLRQRFKVLNDFSFKIFGTILRKSEANKLCGVTFLLLGSSLAFFIFDIQVVILSLLFLGTADPLASLIGVKFGTLKFIGEKSIQGSLAAFGVCTGIAYGYFYYYGLMNEHIILVSFLAGLAGTSSELIPIFHFDDNFTQPVLNGVFLTLIFFYFGGF